MAARVFLALVFVVSGCGGGDGGPGTDVDGGPVSRIDSGPMARVDSGPMPRVDSGPGGGVDSGPTAMRDTGPGGGGDGEVGAACMSDGDCAMGSTCYTMYMSFITFPGGYCSRMCTGMTPGECGPGAECAGGGFGFGGFCARTCTTAAECREGYECRSLGFGGGGGGGGSMYCIPPFMMGGGGGDGGTWSMPDGSFPGFP